jgi:hypothetical protein
MLKLQPIFNYCVTGVFVCILMSACTSGTNDKSAEVTIETGRAEWVRFQQEFDPQNLPWTLETDSNLAFGNPLDSSLSKLYLGDDSGVVFYPVTRFNWNDKQGFIYGKAEGESQSLALLTCDSTGKVLDQLEFFQDYLLDNPESRPHVNITLNSEGALHIEQFLNAQKDSIKEEPSQSFVYQLGEGGNIEDLNHIDQTLSEIEEEVIPLVK